MSSPSTVALFMFAVGFSEPPRPVLDPTKLGIPYERYTVNDSLGRTITFYLSMPPKDAKNAKLSIALVIQGSGCQSIFMKHGDKIGGGLQNLMLRDGKGRFRVLCVEKPGVKFLDQPERPGSAMGASEEFLKEHTLPRWGEANVAALKAAWTLPGIDASKTLAIGHSEGGIIAARVAAELPQVTHVASLAGGGPTQLHSLAELRAAPQPGDKPGDADKRRQQVYEEFAKVRKTPDSITEMWMGHPHRRWSSFLEHSVQEELVRAKAKVYLVQGSDDTSTAPASHDVVVATLLAKGRDVTAERIEGADHGFRKATDPANGPPSGMTEVFGHVIEWFVK